MSTSFIGVDAGGTRTRALLATPHGDVLGRGRAGGANSWSSGASVADAVTRAIAEALEGGQPASVAAGVVAIAGGGSTSPQIAAEIEAGWHGLGLAGTPEIVIDVLAAFAAGTVEADGAVLSAGTGAIAASVRDRRIVRRADGHGWIVGDDGSAVWLGIRGARAAMRALDGRGSATVLSERIPGALGALRADAAATAGAVIAEVHGRPPAELGRLAPVVVEAGMGGDAVASEILEEAIGELEHTLVTAVGERPPPVVVLAGALLNGATLVSDGLVDRLGRRWPGIPVCQAGSGEAGAVALAIAGRDGATVTEEVLERLRA